jgi:hypothetical protein
VVKYKEPNCGVWSEGGLEKEVGTCFLEPLMAGLRLWLFHVFASSAFSVL